jgi:hypothetical protein
VRQRLPGVVAGMRFGRRAAVVALALLVGCAGSDKARKRTVADVPAAVRQIRTVGVLALDVRIYELPAIGTDDLRTDWSQEAAVVLVEAGAAELRRRGFEARVIGPVEETAEELDEVRRLLRAVTATLIPTRQHGVAAPPSGPLPVRAPAARPQVPIQSVGDLSRLTAFYGVDAFALIAARGEVSSGLRAAGQAMLIPLAAVFTFAGGPGFFIGSWGTDQVDVAIVDRRGDLLWLARYASQSTNLRDANDAARSAGATLDVGAPVPPGPAGQAPGQAVGP